MAQNEYKKMGYEIFFWRTQNHIEVDFVLYGSRGLIAIEVKSSSRVREKDFHGLNEFIQDYPVVKPYMLYAGAKSYKNGKIEVIPVEHFLKNVKVFI